MNHIYKIFLIVLSAAFVSFNLHAQTPPPTPATPTATTNTCGDKTLNWNGTPPTKVTWYWQTSSSGTNMDDNNSAKTVSSSGTYYLRAYNFFTFVWSTNSSSVTVTVNQYPSDPSTPSVQDLCSYSTLTRGNPPGGVTWYWQGTNSSGTSTANSNSTYDVYSSGTYYIRALSSGGCWSSSAAVNASPLTPPSDPGNPTSSSNTCGDKILTRSGSPPQLTYWYWQTSANGTSTSNAGPNFTATAPGTFYIRAYDATTGCWSTGAGQITVSTVNPYPSAPSTPSVSNQCGVSVLTQGTPPSGQTWYWQGTNASGTDMSNSSSTYNTFSSNTYYIRARDNSSGCWSISSTGAGTTFIPTPSAVTSVTADANCGTGQVDLSATYGSNGNTVRWYNASSGGSLLQTNTSYSPTIVSTTTYYTSSYSTVTGCESTAARVAVTGTINPIPFGVASTTGDANCGAGQVDLSATYGSNGNTVRWYTASSGGTSVQTNTNYSPSISSTTIYYTSSYNTSTSCESTAARVAVTGTINPVPSGVASTTSDANCGAGVVDLSASYGSNGNTVRWYSASSGGSSLITNTSYSPNIGSTTTYYTSSYNTSTSCESTAARVAVTGTINPVPSGVVSTTGDANCGEGQVDLTASYGSNGNTVRWYDATSGGSLLQTNTSYSPSISSTTTYYTSSYNTSTGCESSLSRMAVTGTINPIPSGVASIIGDANCGAGQVDLTATYGSNGNTVRWYNNFAGGSVLETNTSYSPSISATTTYYTSSFNTLTGCESTAARVAITGTINPLPSYPTPTNASREEPGLINLSSTIGTNGTRNLWYSAPTGGTPLATSQNYTPDVAVTTSFYVASDNPTTGCPESARVPVTAAIYPKPIIGTPNGKVFIMGSPVTLSASNNTYTTYSWKLDNTVVGTSSTYSATQPGIYTLTVTKTGMNNPVAPYDLLPGTSESLQVLISDGHSNLNYVIVNNIAVDGVVDEEDIGLLEVGERQMATSFIGGLGNSLQTILSQGSPDTMDIVQPVKYDALGRQLNQYLPYISTADDSKMRFKALDDNGYQNSEQYSFYQQTTTKISNDTKPYTVTEIEASPMQRMKTQTGVGESWHTAGKKAQQDYLLNRSTDNIRLWKVNSSGLPESASAYGDYQLYISQITDENGNKVKMYTDKLGRSVQKDVEQASGVWLKTCYIYNDLGQQAFVLSPKGVANLSSYPSDTTFLDQWAFRYKYDDLGRLIEYKAPGADWLYTVYDKLDRPVLTQDANLRKTNSWSFVKYDRQGRAVLTGIKTIANSTRDNVQSSVNSQTYMFELALNSSATGYTLDRTYPTISESDLLTVAYYDNYAFISYTGWDAESHSFTLVQEEGHTASSTRVNGLATGGKVRMVGMGSTTWLNAVQYYDTKYRPIQMLIENQLNGLDRTTIKYNDRSQIIEAKSTHNGNESITVVRKMEYDHSGRVEKIYQNINAAGSDQLVALYEYNELGQLVDKKLHNTTGTNFLQSVDYRYTIRGWLESINSPQLKIDDANDEMNDYFGIKLFYQHHDDSLNNNELYNGAISAMKYKGPGAGSGKTNQQSYKYGYDRNNRLLTSTSQVHTGSGWTGEVGSQNENMTYDNNGNIKTLQRYEKIAGSAQLIDNLTYTHTAGNQLSKVEDASSNEKGFKNGVNVNDEYTYDPNGNLTADKNKGINKIVYNILGKPDSVKFSDGKLITYKYNAAGSKLKMSVKVGSTTSTTDYVNGFVYENGSLSFFGSPEGRVVKNGSAFEYQYAIADHQGNTRVVFSSVTPAPVSPTTDFETSTNSNFQNYNNRVNFELMDHTDFSGSTYSYSQKLTGGNNSQVGVARSMKVYPGDKVKIEAYAKHYNPQGTQSNLTGFALALTSAFGVSSSSTGEALQVYNSLNSYGSIIASGGGGGSSSYPKAFVNIILFDKDHNFLDAAWQQIDGGEQVGVSPKAAHDYMMSEVTVKEAGYAYVYVSNESPTLVEFYVDDVTITHTPTNVIQYNEYYPFGLQTAASWTRENTTGNNFLYNAGNELNSNTGVYDLAFRNYDPTLGRFMQVDPMAYLATSSTPYHYGHNNPVLLNDPWGLFTWFDVATLYDNTPDDGIGTMSDWGTHYYERESGLGGGSNYHEVSGRGSTFSGQGSPGSANLIVAAVLSGIANNIQNNNAWGNTAFSDFESYSQHLASDLGIGLLREVTFPETRDNPDWLQERIDEFYTQGGEQTWYYMSREGMPHGMVYDPIGGYIYEINEVPRGMGVLEQLEILILNSVPSNNVKAKISVAYQYSRGNDAEWSSLWNREAGNTYLLSPVTVTNPAAATAWFQGQTGNAWNYSLGASNCAHYSSQGLNAGGAGVNFLGPLPSSFPVAPTMTWTAGQPYPVPIGK